MPIDASDFALSKSEIVPKETGSLGRWSRFGAEAFHQCWTNSSWRDLLVQFSIAVLALLTAASFVTYLLPPAAGTGIDASWKQAHAFFFKHGFQCGRDYTFTYGPLAPFILQVYDRDLFLTTYLVGLACATALTWIFLQYSACLPSRRMQICFLASVTCALGLRLNLPDGVLSAAVVLMFLDVTVTERNASTVRHIAFTFLLTALSLYKVTFLLLSIVAVLLLGLHLLIRRKPGFAILVCASFVASFAVGWMFLGQSLANIPSFLAASWELTVGYSEAMSLDDHPHRLLGGVIALLLFIAGSFPATRCDVRYVAEPKRLCVLLMAAAAIVLNWKHAFSRIDAVHIVDFFWFLMVILLLPSVVLPEFNWRSRFRQFAIRACWVLCLVSLITLFAPGRELWMAASTAWDNLSMRVQYVVTPQAVRLQTEQCRQELAAKWSVPRMKSRIGRRSVDFISFDQGLVFLNDLNWKPRPVFQSYSAYTPRLLQANADHFRGERAPEFVILKSQTIDGRLPTMDDSLALQEILWRYEPILTESVNDERHLLLERRRRGEEQHPQVVDSRTIRFGEEVHLRQETTDCQAIAIKIDLSALGELRKQVYQAPEIRLHVRAADGNTRTFRVVRGMIEAGVLLNPLLLNDRDFLRFFSRDRGARVTSFWLTCGSPWCYRDRIQLTVTNFAKPSSAHCSRAELSRMAAN